MPSRLGDLRFLHQRGVGGDGLLGGGQSLDPALPQDEHAFDDDGWFCTGDLMETTAGGHLRLVDRKKEIYKNIKGETIAPQRVENMFREFDSVGLAFLVGDHRDYNTLLIYPNPGTPEPDLTELSSQEIRDHFRSLVISVNQFLAPYERVVDFAIIDRDLDGERGELHILEAGVSPA